MSGAPEWATGTSFTATCDGQAGWIAVAKDHLYQKIAAGGDGAGYCSPNTLTSFEHVADDVTSAVITGHGWAQFEGRLQPCTKVEARYRVVKELLLFPGMVAKIGRVSRQMCIDPARKLILRDRLEADLNAGPDGDHIVETVTYDRIERNPALSAALFEFQPPTGSKLFEVPATTPSSSLPSSPNPSPTPPGAFRTIVLPVPIAKVDPEYSQEAWDEGIQGDVILLADIELDGSVSGISVRQSLGYGLDEKAIESARK
jgi:TonB-like protein